MSTHTVHTTTVTGYLLRRLADAGVRPIFGVPDDARPPSPVPAGVQAASHSSR
jgi:hypothetical protein